MNEIYGRNLYEKCCHLIENNFQQYFSCRALVDEIVAEMYGVEVHEILNGRKRTYDRYFESRKTIRHRLLVILRSLENHGIITKYSKYTWRKVVNRANASAEA